MDYGTLNYITCLLAFIIVKGFHKALLTFTNRLCDSLPGLTYTIIVVTNESFEKLINWFKEMGMNITLIKKVKVQYLSHRQSSLIKI